MGTAPNTDIPHISPDVTGALCQSVAVLAVVANILADYNVLTTVSGSDGLYKSRQFKGRIHLLLSDFQISGMSGVDLATADDARPP